MFRIVKKDIHSHARLGELHVPSGGVVQTPAYVMVGTHAKVKTLLPEDLITTHTQAVISNTYHLWRGLGNAIDTFEGLHARLGYDGVILTDSGGFQVFSLGFSREHEISKVGFFPKEKITFLRDVWLELRSFTGIRNKKNSVRITRNGAWFLDESYGDTKPVFLNPEKSIRIQEKLGADIILAFDECTSPKHGFWYTKWAMHRTHRWARECIRVKESTRQLLYGIVQGGDFEELRKESARVIGSLAFDGFAIGGSFGKEEMRNVLDWSIPFLPEGKPRHLLGVGRIEDILDGVSRGIDTFDCVIPTREARHGSIWTHEGRYDVKKGIYKDSLRPLEEGCMCETCSSGITRGALYSMFHEKNYDAGRFATIHNVSFFNEFMREIREALQNGTFEEYKNIALTRISRA